MTRLEVLDFVLVARITSPTFAKRVYEGARGEEMPKPGQVLRTFLVFYEPEMAEQDGEQFWELVELKIRRFRKALENRLPLALVKEHPHRLFRLLERVSEGDPKGHLWAFEWSD